jgi:hypothetical protein
VVYLEKKKKLFMFVISFGNYNKLVNFIRGKYHNFVKIMLFIHNFVQKCSYIPDYTIRI